MSKTYILFTEEELDNLRDGIEVKCTDTKGDPLYFMLKKHFDAMIAVSEDNWNNDVRVKGGTYGYC